MKNKTNISNSSIESAGLPKDYKQAIAELIWNGFDANATKIKIDFNANELDYLSQISISDNGTGIDFESLNQTFGQFLDSVKRNSFQRSSYNRGKKGKGRYSFATFSNLATWYTIYKKDDKLLEYEIKISKSKKEEYEDLNKKISKSTQTGTKVILTDLFDVTSYSFSNKEFTDYLAREFGWFLFLNKKSNFSIEINNVAIDYEYLIAENEELNLYLSNSTNETFAFKVTYLRWSESIGDKYYYYLLDENKKETAKKLTSYNNNAIDFHHSVYVESSFFKTFILSNDESENEDLFSELNNDSVYKNLIKDLNDFLFEKQKTYVRTASDHLISKLDSKGVLPKFANNQYDELRKKDLISVVKEIYCIQPKVFKGLKTEQEKTFLGFLNLLLDTDERENILEIIEGIVNLKSEERKELVSVLRKSNFSKILATIKLIENRYKVVELLRTLVFDLKKFTTERDHIQLAIEENYWLFGEEYHLVSADKHFQELLANYLRVLDAEESNSKNKSYDWKKRPDIFMCRKRDVYDSQGSEYQLEENIMVELKRPSVNIGKEQFRQIDDYLEIIMKEDQFNSQIRRWKFFVISNKVDDYIIKQYDAFKDKGKRFLVQQAGTYEIYALTWDDLFLNFEMKHKFLLSKLEFDKNSIREELHLNGINLDVSSSNNMTDALISINN